MEFDKNSSDGHEQKSDQNPPQISNSELEVFEGLGASPKKRPSLFGEISTPDEER